MCDLLGDVEHAGTLSLTSATLDEFMRLDAAAVAALNLLPPPKRLGPTGASAKLSSLHSIMAAGCWSKGGARLLQRWILQPLMSETEVGVRQDMVEMFVEDALLREDLKSVMVR